MEFRKRNLFKGLSISLLMFLLTLSSTPLMANAKMIKSCAVPVINQVLVFDNEKKDNELPDNFRKTTTAIKNPGTLNLKGLNTLNISGSQQYSAGNLNLVKAQLPKDKKLYFIDLRQESHGFINGLPISWEGDGDKANMGLTEAQVIVQNTEQLNSIELGKPLTIAGKTITPEKVYSEETLITDNKDNYIRIAATDTKPPTAEMIDLFVNKVKDIPAETSWLHFHCKEGIGRTTTFMILYDMMKNAKTVPMNDIVDRQIALANLTDKASLKSKDRMVIYENFYNYAKNGDFSKSYSSFITTNNKNN